MKQLVIVSVLACLGSANPMGLLGNADAIYGRLQRNSYVPYPKPDYTRLYLALKNGRFQEQEPELEYDYGPSRPIGPIFEAAEDAMQYDDARDDIPNQQPWLGTMYDQAVDEEGLEQQEELVDQIMSNYFDKKSEAKKAGHVAPQSKVPPKTSAAPAAVSTKAPRKVKPDLQKENKVLKVAKVPGQKEYAMLRPAGPEARRPLSGLWPEDADVQQLKRTARLLLRKTSPPAIDRLTSELDSLKSN